MSGRIGGPSAHPDEDVGLAHRRDARPRRATIRVAAAAFAILAGGLGGLALYIILEAL